MSKRVLTLSYSGMHCDPRVLRQIGFFQRMDFGIVLSGLTYEGKHPFFLLTQAKSFYSRLVKLGLMVTRSTKARARDFLRHSSSEELGRLDPQFDLIVGNDAETWPLAIALKEYHPSAKVIFDAHEQYAKEFEDMWRWQWFHSRYTRHLCEHYIPQADKFTTVCNGIAEDY